jgi:hypothetical protein
MDAAKAAKTEKSAAWRCAGGRVSAPDCGSRSVRCEETAHNAESRSTPRAGDRPVRLRPVRRNLMDSIRTHSVRTEEARRLCTVSNEFSKIETIQAEIRTSPFRICSVLVVVS